MNLKILLDECLSSPLKRYLLPAQVMTVTECGWGGVKNGALLRLASVEFHVMLTMDKGIQYQQNLVGIQMSIVCLVARSNAIHDLLPLLPEIEQVLREVQPGQVYRVGSLRPLAP